MKKNVIDLSYEMQHQMCAFPGDPTIEIATYNNYSNGYFLSLVSTGTHVGTHVDAPVHKIPGAKGLSEIPVEGYIGFRTYVADFSDIAERDGEITAAMLEAHAEEIAGCDAIIFRTGWSKYNGTLEFFRNFPGLSEDTIPWFEKMGIHLLGLDMPSVHYILHAEVHEGLLSRDIYLVESLTNLENISAKYVQFFAVPLKLKGVDGFPVRAFAIELD